MPLIMLAVGGIMALAGLYAMATGLPVIEVERGWTMVIAGSVLLSGGLVVAALGIVVRTLGRLGLGLQATADAPRLAPVTRAAPVMQSPSSGDGMPALGVAAPAAAAMLAAGYGAAQVSEPQPHAMPSQELPSADVPHQPEPEPADHGWHDQAFSAFDLEAPPPPPVAHEAEPAPPEPAPAEPVMPEPPPPAPPEHDVVHTPEAHAPIPEEPVALPPEPVLEDAPHDPAAEAAPEAPSTAPETPPSNLAVIGRYDSDGTSYVMYSDGSIEAQSEAGVFRFGSMAELKAFIEG